MLDKHLTLMSALSFTPPLLLSTFLYGLPSIFFSSLKMKTRFVAHIGRRRGAEWTTYNSVELPTVRCVLSCTRVNWGRGVGGDGGLCWISMQPLRAFYSYTNLIITTNVVLLSQDYCFNFINVMDNTENIGQKN